MNKYNILSTTNLTIGYTSKNSSIVVAKDLNIALKKGKLIAFFYTAQGFYINAI